MSQRDAKKHKMFFSYYELATICIKTIVREYSLIFNIFITPFILTILMNYSQVLEELFSLENVKFIQTLINQKILLKQLGNPEKKLRCIHVTGTNGKGSVCAMLSSILASAGYKVGMYTSPHLKKFNERIRINDKLITDKEIVKLYLKVKPHVTNQTFFEITTSMAFLYFKEKKADFVVLEVGLGGRLDSTNVIKPLISIITNVGIEHTEYLGNTLEEIAYEKSGIIKEGIPVVTAADGPALATIKKISNEKKSPLTIVNKNKIKIIKGNFNNKKNKNTFLKNNWSFDYGGYENMGLGLMGKFQVYNAAIAIEAVKTLKNNYNIKISKKNVINGLKNAKWAGRLQFSEKNVLIDCAHNPHGFKVLAEELKNFKYRQLIAVMGFSKDKDINSIAGIINPLSDKIILTKSRSEKAADPEIIKKYFSKNPIIINSTKDALNYAKKIAEKNDLILVTGSIYMVGEII